MGLPLRRPARTGPRRSCTRRCTGSSAPGRGGLPGNDDSGGLSSWYVWASLGLFPVAGQSLFLVNAPAFASPGSRVNGGEFVIETETGFVGAGRPTDPPQYVQSATLQRRAAGAQLADRARAAPRRPAAVTWSSRRLGPTTAVGLARAGYPQSAPLPATSPVDRPPPTSRGSD